MCLWEWVIIFLCPLLESRSSLLCFSSGLILWLWQSTVVSVSVWGRCSWSQNASFPESHQDILPVLPGLLVFFQLQVLCGFSPFPWIQGCLVMLTFCTRYPCVSQHHAPLNSFLDSDLTMVFSPADILGVLQTTTNKVLYKFSLLRLL